MAFNQREKKMKRLVILSWSQRKVQDKFLMPAMDRYDGPAYKIVRKYLGAVPDARTYDEFLILSAEFGLIPDSRRIPYYDRRMTVERAEELHKQTLHTLKPILSSGSIVPFLSTWVRPITVQLRALMPIFLIYNTLTAGLVCNSLNSANSCIMPKSSDNLFARA